MITIIIMIIILLTAILLIFITLIIVVQVGVCPEQDVFFDKLTVREHLYLFATFKGWLV